MTEEEWFADDPREWDLGGAELEYLEEHLDFEPEIDETRWYAIDVADLENDLEVVQVCLTCGRSISRTPDLWQRIQPHFPTLDDGHGEC